MKQALLTGVTGFVGGKLYHYLKQQGVDVVAIVRSDSSSLINAETKKLEDIKYIVHDLEKDNNLKEKLGAIAFNPSDEMVFYHFAWRGNNSLTDGGISDQLKNVYLTTEAIKQAKSVGCSKFINVGTYEETLMEEFLLNSDQNNFIDIHSIPRNYAIAKLSNRNMCFLTAYLEKIDYIHTRFSVPVSDQLDSSKFIEEQLRQIKAGIKVPVPKNKNQLNFIHIDDLVESYFNLGIEGRNQTDYFIRTDLFVNLFNLFNHLIKIKEGSHSVLNSEFSNLISGSVASKKHKDWQIDRRSILSHLENYIKN